MPVMGSMVTMNRWRHVKKLLVAAASATLVIAASSLAPVGAQDAGPGPRPGRGPGGDVLFGGPGGPGGGDMKVADQFDKDKNGVLDRAERDAAREFLKKERAAGRGGRGFGGPGGPGGRGGRGGPGGFGPGGMLAQQVLAQGDKDADKKLSKDEYVGLAEAWFDKLDADKAGKLNEETFVERFGDLIPPPQGGGDGPQGGPPQGGPPQ